MQKKKVNLLMLTTLGEPTVHESIPLTGEEMRLINGIAISRPCWQYKDIFRYANGVYAYEKIRDLVVTVIPACSTSSVASADISTFVDVGYTGSSRYQKATFTQACKDTFFISVRFGNLTVTSFSALPETKYANKYGLDFIFTVDKIDNRYVITITNVDIGKGTRTVEVSMGILSTSNQIIDNWIYQE